MKAALVDTVGSLDNLKIVNVPEPSPGAGEVLVRLRAASLNFRDLIAVAGGYGSQQRRENLIPLSDGAGEVAEVGAGVTDWRAGDRVVGCFFPNWQTGTPSEASVSAALGGSADGVACEYRVFAQDALLAIPAYLGFIEAATLPCAALTAFNATIGQGLAAGQTALTQGTGGVSLFALQFAVAAGAQVIAISSTDAKLARLRALGAAHVINYRENAAWGAAARRLAPAGADVVVDIGGGETLAQSLRAVRMGGTISVIGVVAGARHPLNVPVVVMKNVRLQGISVGSREQFAVMLATMSRHELRPVVDRVFALDDLRAALEHLRSASHIGKVCIEI